MVYPVSSCRQEFVDAYVNYVFQISVHEWYTAFSSGFLKVCGGKVLELFQPAELRAMVVGNSNYNWEELEEVSSGEQQPNRSAGDPIPSDVPPLSICWGLLPPGGFLLKCSVHCNVLILLRYMFFVCFFFSFGQTAIYKGDYSGTHPTVKLFWETFHEFPLEKKKKFLCKYSSRQWVVHVVV